jgi:hypothetical protein
METTDRFLTVVYRNPTMDELHDIVVHSKMSAIGWSHAFDERDALKWRLTKILNEVADYVD